MAKAATAANQTTILRNQTQDRTQSETNHQEPDANSGESEDEVDIESCTERLIQEESQCKSS